MSERVCFTMHVRKEALEEYTRRHAEVWPEMRAALSEAGWHNYSLFSYGDGTIIAYCEVDDFEAALAAMQGVPVNTRWQAEMAPMFEVQAAPDTTLERLEEIFHLD
jgi:L-rhamnose mutarotase